MQALDYAYTLQGWLKGVNSDALDAYRDIGKDGDVNLTEINPNQFVGADQFGFSLGYYQGDYTPVGGANAQFLSNMAGSTFATAQVGLYNGNISHMVNSSRHVNDQSDVISMGFAYQYDQLNRIRNMVTYEGLDNNTWSSADSPTASSSYTYDKNGNLETLNRSNRNNAPFDLFTYNPVDEENNNKLLSVSDAHTDPLTESTDIDYLAGPYTYDQIGNLISDPSEDIDNIEWTSSGKVRSVTRITGLEDSELHFKYDPTGNRIVKMVEDINFYNQSLAYYKKTYYLRDAQGNIMATYNRTYAGESPQDLTMSFSLVERPIYGSSRIANFVDSVQLVYLEAGETEFSYPDDIELLEHTNGTKHFELTNHLGNVMAVVSDKRTPVLNATATAIETFQPELLIAKDYYPFGMEMSGRYDINNPEDPDLKYRYGFNGMEKDDEVTGQTGSHLNYKYRMYDSRIARFFAVDPITAEYPMLTPYQHSSLNPIAMIEFEGLEGISETMCTPGIGTWGTPERAKEYDEAVIQVINWYSDAVNYFNVNIRVDGGAQFGGTFDIGGTKFDAHVNGGSVELVEVDVSQYKDDTEPVNIEFDYMDKDGTNEVRQGVGFSFFTGMSYEHKIEQNMSSGETINEKNTTTVSAGVVKYSNEQVEGETESTNSASISIGAKVSAIIGISIEVSFGVTDNTDD